jgi:hypothetical protein
LRLRLRGGRQLSRPPEQFQSEIALEHVQTRPASHFIDTRIENQTFSRGGSSAETAVSGWLAPLRGDSGRRAAVQISMRKSVIVTA